MKTEEGKHIFINLIQENCHQKEGHKTRNKAKETRN